MNKPLVVIFTAIVLDAVGIGLIFPIQPSLLNDWQVAGVGTHANGLRRAAVMVNAGDPLGHGQGLGVFDSALVGTKLEHSGPCWPRPKPCWPEAAAPSGSRSAGRRQA